MNEDKREIKYCPNCLKECSISPIGGFACVDCGILQYCTSILLDTPDKEKQKKYKLYQLLRNVIHPNVTEEGLNNLVEDVLNLIKLI